MNFLDLCNQVLIRMREDQMGTVVGVHDNIVHDLVIRMVNDARRLVEDAYDWTNLIEVADAQIGNMAALTPTPPLQAIPTDYAPSNTATIMGVGEGGKIRGVWFNGYTVKMIPRTEMARLNSSVPMAWSTANGDQYPVGDPQYWTLFKVEDNAVGVVTRKPGSSFTLEIYPWRVVPDTVRVEYKKATTPMVMDADMFDVPTQPILNYALAMLARERGEVGGQTSSDLFGIAKQSLTDAIALESQSHNVELNWSVV